MTDWDKLKVTELKDELKSRGIPLTGLKLKQQLIDKLNELDETDEKSQGLDRDAPQVEETSHVSEKQHEDDDEEEPTEEQPVANIERVEDLEKEKKTDHQINKEVQVSSKAEEPKIEQPEDATPIAASSTSIEEKHKPLITQDDTPMKDIEEAGQENIEKLSVEPLDPSITSVLPTKDEAYDEARKTGTLETTTAQSDSRSRSQSTDEILPSTKVPTPEILDDQRKRKRRSVTPTPDADDIAQKKVRTSSGQAVVTKRESSALEQIKAATIEAQANRTANNPDEEPIRPMEASDDAARTSVAKQVGGLPDASELDAEPSKTEATPSIRSPSPKQDYDVTPAIHPATSSLYIRNFKRPLHIPTLRSYVSNLAKSSANQDSDPVKVFYLDSIRTHAFVTFTSISAASRVRNAMHGTRYPSDEQMRDALWIDFIPDDRVQVWIDQETGSGGSGFGGGRGRVGKYEVVYNQSSNGVGTSLEDASQSRARPQASFQHRQSSHMSQDQTSSSGNVTAVHPDRANLIPRDLFPSSRPTQPHDRASQPDRLPAVSDSGKGFTALDSLFSSTQTKPKLYYKTVPQSLVNNRMELLRDLRIGHSEMGRSGDEGMKRYSLEMYKGREEWVDKGPEFGFGRKGQDRLEGLGRGGFRGGRGGGGVGFRGRRGGDSWRGGR